MMKTLVLLKAQRKDATGTLDLFAQPVFVEAYTKRDGTVVTAHVQKVHKKADKPKEGKSGRMSYAQAVSENMKHMGSKLEEWTAIPISGMEEVDAGDDRTAMMPMFDFSDTKDYKPAPSLFAGQSECCHLCGTPIKFHYWIKNDKKKWTMSVGSECVTKFGEGEAGERLAKKAQWEQNRALLRDAIDARKRLFKKFGKKTWTGHLEISPYRAGESKGVDAYLGLRAATGRLHADESLTTGPASKDGPISAFAKRHGEKVREWIAIADEKAPREPPITKAMPTEAQKKAGNYKMKHVRRFGIDITVENRKGSVRSGVGPGGKAWRTKMLFDYGYVKGSLGVDGDHVDCYLGPDDDAETVYIVHQRKAGDWSRYDEDKVMLGFATEKAARDAFLAHYDDPRFLGPITAMPLEEFRRKVLSTRDKPRMLKSAVILQHGLRGN